MGRLPLVRMRQWQYALATDPDGNTLTFAMATGPVQGNISMNADGSFTYMPASNFNGTDAFTFSVNDGVGGSDTGVITVTITPVDDAPVAVNNTGAATEDGFIDLDVIANDTDVDTPNSLLRVAAGSIAGVRGGTAAVLADGRTVRFTPTPDANDGNTPGGFGYSYKVTDGTLVSANEAPVTITVSGGADAPVAVNNTGAGTEDGFVNLDVVANDTDADTANSVLRVAAGSIVNVHGGSAVLQADGRTVRFTPTPDANDGNTAGGFGYSYKVTDGVLVSANEAAVTITVSAIAETPVAVNNTTSTSGRHAGEPRRP